jgi:hypothetical protein
VVLLPLSPGTRLQVNSTVGPLTTEPPSGWPIWGAVGFAPPPGMAAGELNGPQPLPLHAPTSTLAPPVGISSAAMLVPTTSRAATASAPPPGPAGGG